jgi:8-oxo-dGTP diphosphatase
MPTHPISHDSETPAVHQQVFTACAFIHQDFNGTQKVFLPKRAATKRFLPGVFELPGGHIAFGEDLLAGLKREIGEEFGMRIQIGDPFFVFTYLNEIKGSHSIEVVYFATFTDPPGQVRLNPEDHSEYGWFAADEIQRVANGVKGLDDPEIQAIKKGFYLLNKGELSF